MQSLKCILSLLLVSNFPGSIKIFLSNNSWSLEFSLDLTLYRRFFMEGHFSLQRLISPFQCTTMWISFDFIYFSIRKRYWSHYPKGQALKTISISISSSELHLAYHNSYHIFDALSQQQYRLPIYFYRISRCYHLLPLEQIWGSIITGFIGKESEDYFLSVFLHHTCKCIEFCLKLWLISWILI